MLKIPSISEGWKILKWLTLVPEELQIVIPMHDTQFLNDF